MQSVFAAFLVQNFTELGFGLVRAPQELTDALQEGIRGGLARGEAVLESTVEVIEGPRCLFIKRPDLTERVSQMGVSLAKYIRAYIHACSGFERVAILHRSMGSNGAHTSYCIRFPLVSKH
jgi:hypothetical protein